MRCEKCLSVTFRMGLFCAECGARKQKEEWVDAHLESVFVDRTIQRGFVFEDLDDGDLRVVETAQ